MPCPPGPNTPCAQSRAAAAAAAAAAAISLVTGDLPAAKQAAASTARIFTAGIKHMLGIEPIDQLALAKEAGYDISIVGIDPVTGQKIYQIQPQSK